MRRSPVTSALVVFVAVVGLGWPAVTGSAATREPIAKGPVLAERTVYGGLCVSGPCQSVMKVRANGSVTLTVGTTQVNATTLSRKRLAAFKTMLLGTTADPRKLKRSTDCPAAYDGQATKYTLVVGRDTRVFDQCEVVVPTGGVFRELDRMWTEVAPAVN